MDAAGRDRSTPASGWIDGVRQAIETLRDPGARPADGAHPHRADVRHAVLTLLLDGPASGYDLVRAGGRLGGDAPGPGDVYPMLQLLADEGLVTAEQQDGRRVWSLTAAGRAAATASTTPPTAETPSLPRRGALPRTAAQLVQTAVLVGQSGSAEQRAEAAAVLEDARRRLVTILAGT